MNSKLIIIFATSITSSFLCFMHSAEESVSIGVVLASLPQSGSVYTHEKNRIVIVN